MGLQSEGILFSNNSLLNTGLDDISFVETSEGLYLITSSGQNGGLASYELMANGSWVLNDQAFFAGSAALGALDVFGVASTPSGQMVTTSADSGGLSGYWLNSDGTFGGQGRLGSDAATALLEEATTDGATIALLHRAGFSDALMPASLGAGYGDVLTTATVGGTQFLLLADQTANDLSVLMLGEAGGRAHLAAQMGAEQGLGIATPTAMETVEIGGATYVLLAAAGSGSLSVMRLTEAGNLILTDHVIDGLETRFGVVQDIAIAQVGDQVMVLAGGGDDGITLFSLLPDGQLVWRETVADSLQTGLANVSSLAMHVTEDEIQIAVGSQSETGVTLFSLPVPTPGESWSNETGQVQNRFGTANDDILVAVEDGDTLRGGDGDDILVAGAGRTILSGGDGNDTFVLRVDSTNARIVDFDKAEDRLDLSSWQMLRDPGALDVTTTTSGLTIEYRGYRLEVVSADGSPMTVTDLFAGRFQWADHMMISVDEASHDDEPGLVLRAVNSGETFTGSAWEDRLIGGDGEDTLFGYGGNDLLVGGEGEDSLEGGEGDDTLYGNDDDDTLHGISGANLLSGGNGRDYLSGGADNDTLLGGNDDDRLIGREGNDSLRGNDGNDVLYGLDGDDILRGDAGIDYLSGGDGDDTLSGGSERDTLFGGDGEDRLIGDGGDDSLRGNGDDDVLYGLDGDDMMRGDDGVDYLSGGNDDDTLTGGGGDDTLFGGTGKDRLIGGNGDDSLRGNDGDDVLYGLDGDDMMRGDDGVDYLSGGNDDDTLTGGGGDDTLFGGSGEDRLIGGNGDDSLRGNGGDDVLYGLDGDDILRGDSGRNMLSGGDGEDSVYGGTSNDTLYGGADADQMAGGGGDDVLNGNDGDDRLYGNDGDDLVQGGAGDDALSGGSGNDTLIGGLGRDVLTGGDGEDVFSWEDPDASPDDGGRDVIRDFETGVDILDLSQLAEDLEWVGRFSGGGGEVLYDESIGRLYVELDGDGAIDLSIDLEGSPALSVADLLL